MGAVVDVRGNAVVVTLSWPNRRNALGPDEATELAEALRAAAAGDALAVILHGEQAFCAGGDLPAILAAIDGATPAQVEELIYGRFQQVARALRDCPLPTVAAIDGAAIGLGLDIALWCDRIFLGSRARLGQGWGRVGLIPGTGGAALLQHRAPGLLWELLGNGTGELSSERAARAGLGTLVPSAFDAALEYVEHLAPVGRDALLGYARLSRGGLPDDEYLRHCARLQSLRLTSRDFADHVGRSRLTSRWA